MRRAWRSAQSGRLAVALVTSLAMVVAACGGNESPDAERPLTQEEWALLGNVLFQNHDRGGATFQLALQVGEAASINLQGRIDWRSHVGYAQVSGKGVETGVREVY